MRSITSLFAPQYQQYLYFLASGNHSCFPSHQDGDYRKLQVLFILRVAATLFMHYFCYLKEHLLIYQFVYMLVTVFQHRFSLYSYVLYFMCTFKNILGMGMCLCGRAFAQCKALRLIPDTESQYWAEKKERKTFWKGSFNDTKSSDL